MTQINSNSRRRRAFRLAALTAFLTLGLSFSARAADYYVSPSGSDSNSGTSTSSPWQTVGKVNAANLNPGDKVLFQGGATFGGNIYLAPEDAGSASSPVTISSYGTGRATISAGTLHGIYAYNNGGFVIQNLNFVGAGLTTRTDQSTGASYLGTDSTDPGIIFYTDSPGDVLYARVHIDSVDISGFEKGVEMGSWLASGNTGRSGYTDVRLTNADVHDNLKGGIFTYSYTGQKAHTDVYLGHVTAYNHPGDYYSTGNTGSGIVISGVNGATVERSVAYNNGWQNRPSEGPVGIWTYDANAVTIQFNESYGNRTSGADGGGFDLDGGTTNSIVQYNYSHDNAGAGYLLAQYGGASTFGGNVIRYNVSQNDGRKGGYGSITVWGASGSDLIQNTDIYNNTIYVTEDATGSIPAAVRLFNSNHRNVNFHNNLFIATGGADLISGTFSSDDQFINNTYWTYGSAFKIKSGGTTYTSLSAWRSATNQETLDGAPVGFQIDPLLNNPGGGITIGDADLLETRLDAYKLQSASPMVDAGLNLTASPFSLPIGARDFYGNSLPQGADFDLGAHEFFNTTPTPPPAPINLRATAGNAQVTLNWAASAGATSYNVKRSTASGGSYTTVATNVTATSYTDAAASNGTTYYYVVSALNANGESANSNEASATPTAPLQLPAAPSNLTATVISKSQINLAWADNAATETGFKIERCAGAGCTNFTQIATVGANVTSYANTGLARNTTYTYRVCSYNATGNSAYSNTASAKTLRK